VIHLAGRRARSEGIPAGFGERPQRSRLLQRLADAGEAESEARWRTYRVFAGVAEKAGRRAAAVARLECELRSLDSRAG
jgi:hypothetical protein